MRQNIIQPIVYSCKVTLSVVNIVARALPPQIELFYLNSTLNFGIPTLLVFQLEVYYKVDRLLTGLTAQQKGTTAQWYSKKHLYYVVRNAGCTRSRYTL